MATLSFSCPKCGTPLAIGDAQCKGCGVRINTAAYAGVSAPASVPAPAPAPAPAQAMPGVPGAPMPMPAPTPMPASMPGTPHQPQPQQAPHAAPQPQPQPATNQPFSAAAPASAQASQAFANATEAAAAQFKQVASSANVQQAKQTASNFFGWVLASIRHPSLNDVVPSWFGVLSLVLQPLCIALMVAVSVGRMYNPIQPSGNASLDTLYSGTVNHVVNNVGHSIVGTAFNMVVVTVICQFIFLALTYAAYRMNHKEPLSFLGFVTRVAQYSNINLLFSVLAMLFGIINVAVLSGILLVMSGPIFYAAAIVVLAEGRSTDAHETMHLVYLPMLGSIISAIIYMIFSLASIMSVFENVLGAFHLL